MFESLFRRFFEIMSNHLTEDKIEMFNYKFEVVLIDVIEATDQNLVVV